MKKILLDANYILRWFLGDVPHQEKIVQQLLETASESSLLFDRISAAEVTYVLRSMGYDRKQIAIVIIELHRYPSVTMMSNSLKYAMRIYQETTSLDFEDCWLIAKATTDNYTVASFDKKLLSKIQST